MNTSFVVVCLIVVGCVFIPFFLFNALGKPEYKKMNGKIKQLVAEHNLKISELETWGYSYLGLDTHQKKLIFLKMTTSECLCQLFDLNNVNDCKIKEQRKVLKIRNKNEQILEKLDLEIFHKNGDISVIPIYDNEENRVENFENARAEKWKTMLMRYISNNPVSSRAA